MLFFFLVRSCEQQLVDKKHTHVSSNAISARTARSVRARCVTTRAVRMSYKILLVSTSIGTLSACTYMIRTRLVRAHRVTFVRVPSTVSTRVSTAYGLTWVAYVI